MNHPKDTPTESSVGNTQEIEFLNGSPDEPISPSSPPISDSTAQFMEQLTREIELEVRAKRAQGAFPPAFERRLKSIFEQLVPPGAGNSRRDFEALLRSSDRAAYFDIDVPIASQKPGIAKVKKVLRMTQAWYLNYLAQQLNNFSTNLMRLLYVFDARVKKLEETIESKQRVIPSGGLFAPRIPKITIKDDVWAKFGKVKGRILVADCDNGEIVSQINGAGLDGYGIDSHGSALEHPVEKNLDLRWQPIEEHLREIADGALAAIVLQGSIDHIPPTEKIDLVLQALRALDPSGALVILGTDPVIYGSDPRFTIQREIAPGRPFSLETWEHIFERLQIAVNYKSSDTEGYVIMGSNANQSRNNYLKS